MVFDDNALKLVEGFTEKFRKIENDFWKLECLVKFTEPEVDRKEEIEEVWREVRDLTCLVNGMTLLIQSLKGDADNIKDYYKIKHQIEVLEYRLMTLQSYAINLKLGKLDCIP